MKSTFLMRTMSTLAVLVALVVSPFTVLAKEVADSTLATPPAPTNLQAAANGTTSIGLSWTKTLYGSEVLVDYNYGYAIYRTTGDNMNFSGLTPYAVVMGTNNTSYSDTSVTAGTKYNYKVAARGSDSSESANSNLATVTIASPVSLQLSGSVANNSQIQLSWNSYPNAVTYRLQKKTGNGSFMAVDPILTGTSYTDTNVQPGVTYTYYVQAGVYAQESTQYNASSNETSFTLTSPTVTPSTEDKPVITGVAPQPSLVRLQWTEVPGFTSYTLYRRTGAGADTIVTSGSVLSYDDTTVTPNTDYSYYVIGQGSVNSTQPSNTYTVHTPASPSVVPPAPLPIQLTATSVSDNEIDLSWNPQDNTLEYRIYRSTQKDGGFMFAGVTNKTTARDFQLQPQTTYYYSVQAIELDRDEGVKSNVASATTMTSGQGTSTTIPPIISTPYPVTPDYSTTISYPYPSDAMPLTAGTSAPTTDACGRNDTMSPARILNPQSDIKFTMLPKTAVFRPGNSFTFTYCYKGQAAYPVKIVRSLYTPQGMLVGTQTVGRRTLRAGQVFSLTPSQVLGKTIAAGEYHVRIQIVDESVASLGDEPIPAGKLLADNAFAISVTNELVTAPSFPAGISNPGNLMVPQSDASQIRFPYFSKRNTYRAGETFRFPLTFKNTTGVVKRLTVQYRLTNSSGTVVSTQSKPATLANNKTLSWTVAQPILVGLPAGIYTFTAVVIDQDNGQQLDTNSFSFAVSM